jgi:ankyrin repeat protein
MKLPLCDCGPDVAQSLVSAAPLLVSALLVAPLLLIAGGGVSVKSAEGDGSTPLHQAVYNNDPETAARLIRSGADVNAANDLGATPLWIASQNGGQALVKTLLDAGANPNAALLAGETPMMVAARAGYAGIVEQLIAKGADVNKRAARAQTALMWAVAQKHPEVVKVLLARGADVQARSDTWTLVMAVPPHGYLPYNRAIPHGADTALLFAARVGDLESAKLLVAAGANVNDHDAWGVSATVLAAHSGFRDLVEFLLEKGADPNQAEAGFTALHEGIMRRDEEMVAALLDHGADANAPLRTWTPTRRSSKDLHFEPALVGATPYWLAARFTEPAVMRLLVKHGADPLVVHTSEYVTGGRYEKHTEKTNALLAATGMGGGIAWFDPPKRDREALTLEAVKLAVELGADIGAINTDGQTALDAAKKLEYKSVVDFLSKASPK